MLHRAHVLVQKTIILLVGTLNQKVCKYHLRVITGVMFQMQMMGDISIIFEIWLKYNLNLTELKMQLVRIVLQALLSPAPPPTLLPPPLPPLPPP